MLIVAITGSGDTTLNNAAALLDDYLPEDVLVFTPSYITSDGMRVVVQWLKDEEVNIERVRKNELEINLLDYAGAEEEKVLIVLGIEGSEDIIKNVMSKNIPVLDLTRGLYRVTESEIALDGSESEPETQTGEIGTPTGSEDHQSLQSLSEAWEDVTSILEELKLKEAGLIYRLSAKNGKIIYVGQTKISLQQRLYAHKNGKGAESVMSSGNIGRINFELVSKAESMIISLEKISELEADLIHNIHPVLNRTCVKCDFYKNFDRTKEIDILREKLGMEKINWEHTADPRMPVRPETSTEQQENVEENIVAAAYHDEERKEQREKAKYFQNGKGKIRKAGRSKIKPGEKEVYLTDEEAQNAS